MLRNIHFQKWNKDRCNFLNLFYQKLDYHCKVKETLLIQELKPALNVNVSSEKLILY